MQEQLQLVTSDFKRYMYHKLAWEARLVGLVGPRGVGKSTMILQHLKEQDTETKARSIYLSADHSYFLTHTLADTAGIGLSDWQIYLRGRRKEERVKTSQGDR